MSWARCAMNLQCPSRSAFIHLCPNTCWKAVYSKQADPANLGLITETQVTSWNTSLERCFLERSLACSFGQLCRQIGVLLYRRDISYELTTSKRSLRFLFWSVLISVNSYECDLANDCNYVSSPCLEQGRAKGFVLHETWARGQSAFSFSALILQVGAC